MMMAPSPQNISRFWKVLLSIAVMFIAVPAAGQNPQFQQAPVNSNLFSDNFASGFSQWAVGTNTIGRTQFGQTPALVTGASGGVSTFAQFKLDTYNSGPSQQGVTFLGTQLQTLQQFSLPAVSGVPTGQGIRFRITSRIETTGLAGPAGQSGAASIPVSQGLTAANFSYGYSPASSGGSSGGSPGYLNEIDVENLTSQQMPPTIGNPSGATNHTNSYFTTSNGDATLATSFATTADGSEENSYYAQTPYAPHDTGVTTAPINIYQWHTYDIDWHPSQIDWYVDGLLVREEAPGETSTANPTVYVPNHPMAYYLNFWAPASTFSDAFANLAPSGTAAGNQEFYFDVANASVDVIAPIPEPAIPSLACLIGGMLLIRSNRLPSNRN